MEFPVWAPTDLVELLERRRISHAAPKSKFDESLDVEEELKRIQEKYPQMTQDDLNKTRFRLWRHHPFLPPKEGDNLLERMLKCVQMKGVWEALRKRAKSDRYAISFWQSCDSIYCAWRGNPRQSPVERRGQLEKIQKCALELIALMQSSPEFMFYRPSGLITDEQVKCVIEALDCCGPYEQEDQNFSYARFVFSDIVPSIEEVIIDIHRKAGEYAEEAPVVKKPQSKNAEVHHFVRVLSGYLKKEYGQPLHDAVAMTACTVFERDDIDSDFVRKLVVE